MTAVEVGHGPTPWHCACHGTMHAVPSLAWRCEQRTAETEEG